MNKLSILLTTGVILTCLTGCAHHMSRKQCLNTNWSQAGYNDAMNDQSPRDLTKAISDCQRYKLKVNTTAYHRGWKQGANAWCDPSRAKQLGVSGKTYNDICPANKKQRFRTAWQRGLRSYCIPSNGYQLGVSGKPYTGFCNASQNTAFQTAYNKGFNFHRRRQQIVNEMQRIDERTEALNNNVRDYENSIEDALYKIAHSYRKEKAHENHAGEDIALTAVVANDRIQISQAKQEIRGLNRRKRNLERQLMTIDQQISRAQI